jgi:hypothetical protein
MYASSGNLDQFTDDFLESDEFFLRVAIQAGNFAEIAIATAVFGHPRHDRAVVAFAQVNIGNSGFGAKQIGQTPAGSNTAFLNGKVQHVAKKRAGWEQFWG